MQLSTKNDRRWKVNNGQHQYKKYVYIMYILLYVPAHSSRKSLIFYFYAHTFPVVWKQKVQHEFFFAHINISQNVSWMADVA